MSIKVIDGARTLDGANNGLDIAPANYATGNTANSTGVDMSEFFELIAMVQAGVVVGTATVTVYAQESDDNSTFTNISGASVSFVNNADSNTGQVLSVNWKHPGRKRYARVSGVVSVANAAIYGVSTLRVQPHGGPMTIDSSVDETK